MVGIFNGTITTWNDSSIQSVNPSVQLPVAAIRTVVRADYSGTTQIFTSSLSTFDQGWSRDFGTFAEGLGPDDQTPVRWNQSVVDLFGRTSKGHTAINYGDLCVWC